MCGLGSNGVHYSLSSKVTVVKLWPSVIGEVTYLSACLTVSYDHLSSYGSGVWLVGLRCFTLFPLYWLYMACVLCRCCPHKSHKSFSDYVERLLGYFFSTNVLFVEKRSFASGQMCGTCEAPTWWRRSSSSLHILRIFHRLWWQTVVWQLATPQMLVLMGRTAWTTCWDSTPGIRPQAPRLFEVVHTLAVEHFGSCSNSSSPYALIA